MNYNYEVVQDHWHSIQTLSRDEHLECILCAKKVLSNLERGAAIARKSVTAYGNIALINLMIANHLKKLE
ncbi:MAG: hypothetical protein KI790_12795 [Cyclobacteriaceae bacterium]|nr:hypothetical protein [Cyclobacteriaceae bacterium HetDA_MAG_MS6]